MSRTDSMPEVQGFQKIIRALRYHEASRQWFAIIFVLLVSYFGSTSEILFLTGSIIAVIGIIIRLWASGYVMKNKVLSTTGPYAYVRHPLYVGNILLLAGFSIASGLWWSYLLMAGLLWFYYPPTISYEDNKLHGLFGEEWENWSKDVKALIPTFPGKAGSLKSEWSLKKSFIQNGEPVIVAYLIWCLYLLYTN